MSKIVCDKARCVGCLSCVVSCIDHHYPESETSPVPHRLYRRETLPSGLMQYFTDNCRHCKNAPCAKACPAGAIKSDENGFVQVISDKCTGCRACEAACPFKIPRYNRNGIMTKCDGCKGKEPACVSVCPRGALKLI